MARSAVPIHLCMGGKFSRLRSLSKLQTSSSQIREEERVCSFTSYRSLPPSSPSFSTLSLLLNYFLSPSPFLVHRRSPVFQLPKSPRLFLPGKVIRGSLSPLSLSQTFLNVLCAVTLSYLTRSLFHSNSLISQKVL